MWQTTERMILVTGFEPFGTHTAKHHFCKTCGIHAFYEPRSHPGQIDVNVRCLDDPKDIARFAVEPFDGRNWEDNVEKIR